MERMTYLVYSKEDGFASRAAEMLRDDAGFSDAPDIMGLRHFASGSIDMLELGSSPVYADWLDGIGADEIVFISRHSSSKGIISFTAHAEGNWNDKNDLGGKPHALSVASPGLMISFLKAMKGFAEGTEVVYEATHHGPLLDTPSCFVELGPDAVISERDRDELLRRLSKGVYDMLYGDSAQYDKVAVGIGGMHYSAKFTRYALEGKYAFSHIMSKYYVDEVDMLQAAIDRSTIKPDTAVIEWKSINAVSRNRILAKLEDIGMDYERV
ncbi:MAG: D-aminoacyl-tRNA deacylase [Candidatus Micrarchaeaceae archaeon]|nr:D-aminoacyl-tRNA deacylase [Candidatus Marsarchaeota archaeon]